MGEQKRVKFRVWDKKNKKWTVNVVIDTLGLLSWQFGDTCRLIDDQDTFVVEWFTGMIDQNEEEIWEGDLRWVVGRRMYKVINEGFRFSFERNLVEFGDNHKFALDEDSGYMSDLIGNIHQNPELLKP